MSNLLGALLDRTSGLCLMWWRPQATSWPPQFSCNVIQGKNSEGRLGIVLLRYTQVPTAPWLEKQYRCFHYWIGKCQSMQPALRIIFLPVGLSKNVNWVRSLPSSFWHSLLPDLTWACFSYLISASPPALFPALQTVRPSFISYLAQSLHMQIPQPRELPSQVNPIPNLSYYWLIFTLLTFTQISPSHITLLAWVLSPSVSVLSLCPNSHSLDMFNWCWVHIMSSSPL